MTSNLTTSIAALRDAMENHLAAWRAWAPDTDERSTRRLDATEFIIASMCRDHLPAVLDAAEKAEIGGGE